MEVLGREVVRRLMDGAEDLDQFTTMELETAKMFMGLLESTVELELAERYQKPIDVAEQNEHLFLAQPEPPNWRPTCACGWKDRRLVPTEKQAEYAWKTNHSV